MVNVGDQGFHRRVKEIIERIDVKENDVILDCGCGEGFYLMVLHELFPHIKIYGLDHDPQLIEKAKTWIGPSENVYLFEGSIYNMPYDDDHFDNIILSEVLEHLQDEELALKEVKRVLRPGGTLVVTVPNHNYPFFWDPLNWLREHLGFGHFSPDSGFFGGIWSKHLRLYSPEEIKNVVSNSGFNIESIKNLTHYCFPFTQNVLYFGKQLYTKLPVPLSIVNTMEKFEWRKISQNKFDFNFLRLALSVYKFVDKLNDRREIKLSESSMGILLVAKKNI